MSSMRTAEAFVGTKECPLNNRYCVGSWQAPCIYFRGVTPGTGYYYRVLCAVQEDEDGSPSINRCGFRKPGLYLMGPIPSEPCERLPFPFYGGWPKFMRGWLSINPSWLFEEHLHPECNLAIMGHNHDYCPVCNPPSLSYPAHYILWVGKQFYTP